MAQEPLNENTGSNMEKRRVTVHDATITKRDAIDSFLDPIALPFLINILIQS